MVLTGMVLTDPTIRAHQSSLNRIGRMASHLPMPRDLNILLKEYAAVQLT